jgi:ribokinase
VAAARIGLNSALVTHVGKDENGEKCIQKLKEEGVSTKYVMSHPNLQTNYHYVLWYGTERTILIKHELFPFILPDLGNTKWLYLSSLGETSLPFHDTIADYLDTHPEIKLVFQPGTFQIKFGTEALQRIYRRSELFFCNLEEAQIILNINTQSSEAKNISMLLTKLRTLGPKIPVITDGPNGAYVFVEKDGVEKVAHLPIFPDIAPPLERTGAGDAFASTFSTAIALGKSIEDALKWGAINSMNVCQKVGARAGLLTRAEIEAYLQNPPDGWDVEYMD